MASGERNQNPPTSDRGEGVSKASHHRMLLNFRFLESLDAGGRLPGGRARRVAVRVRIHPGQVRSHRASPAHQLFRAVGEMTFGGEALQMQDTNSLLNRSIVI